MAGLLFGIAFACACVAICGFLLERTVFSPAATFDSADVVLENDLVRDELVSVISTATVDQIAGGDAGQAAVIEENIAIVASTKAGSELLAEILRDAHSHIIGRTDDPVQITPDQLVQVVRDERASLLPPITLDVPRIGALAVVDEALDLVVPVAAIAALVFFLLCLFAHPEKAALIRSLGIGLIVLGALTILFAWVIPAFVPPLLSDSAWAEIPSSLAAGALPLTLGAALVLAGVGLGLFAAGGRMRRTRRWSTPVSTYRYREERSWS